MANPLISMYNHETGETEVREMTNDEVQALQPKELPENWTLNDFK